MSRLNDLSAFLVIGFFSLINSQAVFAQQTPQTKTATASDHPVRKNPKLPQERKEAPPWTSHLPVTDLGWRLTKTKGQKTNASIIREPSQGHPIFITPGESFYFVMNLPANFTGDVGFFLQHAMEPTIHIPLKPKTPPSYVNNEYFSLVLMVGADTPPGLYDLMVHTKSSTYSSRHSVKVIDAFKDKFRFVHLSNMNVGVPTAPDFDAMIPLEVNLLAPDFIIATGDYTEWARTLDDAGSWQRILAYFAKFDAPVFMLCGSHDHEASFSRFVASDPIDRLDYGQYHGLLLLDHPGNPIDQDYSQLQWIDADLKQNRHKRMNFIVSNSDELGLIDIWRERGNIEKFIADHKIRMYIAGGNSDWDFKEFATKLHSLDHFHFIRTHESSTALRGRSTGVSHYRVIDVDGDKLSYIYPNDTAAEKLQYSIPTGRLRAYFEAPNDGTAQRVGVTIQNALNQAFDSAHVWIRIAKNGDKRPVIKPGRVIRILDADDHWACEVACDLPDKGAIRIVASTNPSDLPGDLPIDVALDGSSDWSFTQHTTKFGLSYFASKATVTLKLRNKTKTARTCWPMVRINGNQIAFDPSVVTKLPLSLKPTETLAVPLVLNLRRISPGSHKLQVYFLEDPLARVYTFDVNLAFREDVAQLQTQSSISSPD